MQTTETRENCGTNHEVLIAHQIPERQFYYTLKFRRRKPTTGCQLPFNLMKGIQQQQQFYEWNCIDPKHVQSRSLHIIILSMEFIQ